MTQSIFQRHPSQKLNLLYKVKSYQGANPTFAKILFIGRDPNWDISIDESPIFDLINEYLNDGVQFWQKYNIHHPFLHPKYDGEGKKYHNAISRLNFENRLANYISFIEIIGFPTTGMSSTKNRLFNEYLLSDENLEHLIELDILLNDSDKLIFVYWGMLDLLKYLNRKTGLFAKFKEIDKKSMCRTDLNKFGNIYFHKHFSMGISPATLSKISNEVLSYLDLNMVNVIPENDIKRSNKPAINSKQGWEASFAEMHKNGDDKLLIDSYFEDEKL
jgi:hypothetical protein